MEQRAEQDRPGAPDQAADDLLPRSWWVTRRPSLGPSDELVPSGWWEHAGPAAGGEPELAAAPRPHASPSLPAPKERLAPPIHPHPSTLSRALRPLAAVIAPAMARVDAIAARAVTAIPVRRRVPLAWAALVLAYVVLALRMLDPISTRLSTGLLGCCDALQQAWGHWWTAYALLTLRQSPLMTDYQFHPLTVGATGLITIVSYSSVLSIPLQLLFGLTAAVNLVVLLGVVLAGVGAFALIRAETGDWRAALPASLMLAFPPAMFARLEEGHYATIAYWPTPWLVLAWFVALRRDRWWAAAIAGGLLGVQFSIGPYQGAFDVLLLFLLTVTLLAYRFRAGLARRPGVIAVARSLGIAAAAFVLAFGPHLAALLPDLQRGAYVKAPLDHSDSFAPDLLAYFIPFWRHRQLGPIFADLNRLVGAYDPVRVVFPGYLAWALGLAGAVSGLRDRTARRRTLPWVIVLVVCFVLSLGPSLHLAGQTRFAWLGGEPRPIPLPFAWYWQVPLLGDGRITANLTFTVSLCLAVLSGGGLALLFRRLGVGLPGPLAALAALVVLFEGLATPITMPSIPISPFYERLAREPGEFAVLEVPLAWRDGFGADGEFQAELLRAATIHQKPVVDGYLARAPRSVFEHFRNLAPLRYLVTPAAASIPSTQDRATVHRTLRELNVRYVILRDNPRKAELERYLAGTIGLREVFRDGLLVAYVVD